VKLLSESGCNTPSLSGRGPITPQPRADRRFPPRRDSGFVQSPAYARIQGSAVPVGASCFRKAQGFDLPRQISMGGSVYWVRALSRRSRAFFWMGGSAQTRRIRWRNDARSTLQHKRKSLFYMATKWVGQCSLLPKFQTLKADERRKLRLLDRFFGTAHMRGIPTR
jgi:hypothetical protein